MVNRPMNPDEVKDFGVPWVPKRIAKRGGRKHIDVKVPDYLYEKILAESRLRQWTMAHMVRFLIEASIDGIE